MGGGALGSIPYLEGEIWRGKMHGINKERDYKVSITLLTGHSSSAVLVLLAMAWCSPPK